MVVQDFCLYLSAPERKKLELVEGMIFDIQRYSLHDGPGLRTNVFFKGCPLRCGWCSNPESQSRSMELAVFAVNCIACGQFAETCPALWKVQADATWKKEAQAEFARRAELCPAEGVRWFGRKASAGTIMDEVRRDMPFYEGGGGLTPTVGEPVMQPDLAEALLRLAKADCISTAIETTGYARWQVWERLVSYLDTILYDVKHIDAGIHRQYTGVDNRLILENLARLATRHAQVIVRVPLIPGFNADRRTLNAIGRYITGLSEPLTRVDLLPYHTLGKAKYSALAVPYPWNGHQKLADEDIQTWADDLRHMGLTVTVGG